MSNDPSEVKIIFLETGPLGMKKSTILCSFKLCDHALMTNCSQIVRTKKGKKMELSQIFYLENGF